MSGRGEGRMFRDALFWIELSPALKLFPSARIVLHFSLLQQCLRTSFLPLPQSSHVHGRSGHTSGTQAAVICVTPSSCLMRTKAQGLPQLLVLPHNAQSPSSLPILCFSACKYRIQPTANNHRSGLFPRSFFQPSRLAKCRPWVVTELRIFGTVYGILDDSQ